jgi:hypothetical protein
MDPRNTWRNCRRTASPRRVSNLWNNNCPTSLKTDIRKAGGTSVSTDNGLVTSRKPDDIPAFNREMIALFGETGAAKRTRTENRVGACNIQRDAGSAWFLAEPVSAAVPKRRLLRVSVGVQVNTLHSTFGHPHLRYHSYLLRTAAPAHT